MMKVKKDKIIEFFKQPLIYVVVICILVQLQIYKTIPSFVITDDSHTYMEEYTQSIFKGQVDRARTPGYPYLIKAIKLIGGEERLCNNVVAFQKILFILTLVLFYYCVQKTTNNRIITTILTIIFGICPFIVFWNIMLLTEALSLFEFVLLCLITIQYLKNPNKILAVLMRNSSIIINYDKTIKYLFITNIFGVLDFKIYF